MSSETSLINAALIYLRSQGCMVWRANTGAMRIQTRGQRDRFVRFGPVGQPDVVGYGPHGRGIACECKRGKNQPTSAQLTFLAEAKSRGVFAVCIWDIEELIKRWEEFKSQPIPDRHAVASGSRVAGDLPEYVDG